MWWILQILGRLFVAKKIDKDYRKYEQNRRKADKGEWI